VFLFAALIAAGLWLWFHFNPSPEQAIRRQLAGLAETATFEGPQGLAATALDAQKLASFFGPDVRMNIEPRGWFEEEVTRQEISQFVAGFRSRSGVRSLRVQFLDPIITVAADRQNAVVEVTVNAESGGERHLIVQELKLTMQQVEGKWLITGVETIRTLNQAPPQFPASLPGAA
jgi:hypothetical protein